MRKNTPILVSVVFIAVTIISGLLFLNISTEQQETLPYLEKVTSKKKLSKYDRIDKAIELEFEKTVDPALGYVPRHKLMAAQEMAAELRSMRAALVNVNWTERGPKNVSGRTRAILIDPNDATGMKVWAGGVSGGLWKTANIYASETEWQPVDDMLDNLAVTTIAADPTNTSVMYFGTGEGWFNADAVRGMGIWKSTDAGNTWNQLSATNNSSYHYVQEIQIDPSNGNVFAATQSGLFRSTDGGTSWTKVLGAGVGATFNRAADIDFAVNGDIFCTMGLFQTDGIYKSTDGGATWTKLSSGLPASGYARIAIATAPSDANRIYAIYQSNTTYNALGIYKSTDGGATWTTVTNPAAYGMSNFARGQAWYNLTLAVDPNNADRVYIGGIDILSSADAGTSWTQVTQWYGGGGYPYVHADQHAIVFKPGSSDTIFFGNDGGIFMTKNGSVTSPAFETRVNNYNITQFYGAAAHPDAGSNYFLAGAQDNGTHKFTGYGINATAEVTGGDGGFCHIDQDNSQYQFTSYVYSNYRRSTDGGKTFANGPSDNNGRFINPTDFDDLNNKMYTAYSANNILRWDDPHSGFTYTIISVPDFNGRQASAVTVSPNTANRVFFGTDRGRVIRMDNAHTATPTLTYINSAAITGNIIPQAYITCIEVQRGNDDHMLITFSNYGVKSVFETKDGGATWQDVEGNLPDMPVRWALFNPNDSSQALIATEVGVWSTDNLNGTSTSWGPSNTGLANVRVDMLQLRASDNIVIAATHGRGLYTSDVFADETADFYAEKYITYAGKAIQFYDASYQATSWSWNFGDGNSSTQQNPSHIYNTSGKYTITLTINSGAATKTKTGYVHVLPNKYIPYLVTDGGSFENNPDDFSSLDQYGGINLWEKGTPTNYLTTLNTTFNGWKTDLDANVTNADYQSALYTPNFDFVTAGTYTLSFRMSMQVQFCNAPFAVQLHYSTDKGDTWTRLGSTPTVDGNGSNWYNSGPAESCAISASVIPDQTGWAGTFNNALATYDVSFLSGNSDVAFRYVLYTEGGWSNGYTADGFMIDDFEVTGPAFVLPVTYQDFDARLVEDHSRLTWVTATEKNNDGFEVQRSRDGNDFTSIGFVKGNGTVSEASEYSFNDHDITSGIYFYRLKQIDHNGDHSYSQIREVNVKALSTVKIYPNPAKDHMNISVSGVRAISAVTVVDVSGRVVFQENIHSGTFEGNMNIRCREWPKGIYFVRLSGADEQVFKVVKY